MTTVGVHKDTTGMIAMNKILLFLTMIMLSLAVHEDVYRARNNFMLNVAEA